MTARVPTYQRVKRELRRMSSPRSRCSTAVKSAWATEKSGSPGQFISSLRPCHSPELFPETSGVIETNSVQAGLMPSKSSDPLHSKTSPMSFKSASRMSFVSDEKYISSSLASSSPVSRFPPPLLCTVVVSSFLTPIPSISPFTRSA